MVVLLPPHPASSLVWRLALALLYEWMGVALVTSSDAVITVLVDKRWRAVHVGWFGVKHNWVLPPPGKDNAGRKGEEKTERDSGDSLLPSKDQTSGKGFGETGD